MINWLEFHGVFSLSGHSPVALVTPGIFLLHHTHTHTHTHKAHTRANAADFFYVLSCMFSLLESIRAEICSCAVNTIPFGWLQAIKNLFWMDLVDFGFGEKLHRHRPCSQASRDEFFNLRVAPGFLHPHRTRAFFNVWLAAFRSGIFSDVEIVLFHLFEGYQNEVEPFSQGLGQCIVIYQFWSQIYCLFNNIDNTKPTTNQ